MKDLKMETAEIKNGSIVHAKIENIGAGTLTGRFTSTKPNAPQKVYLASGWFNEEQERRVAKAEKVLRGLGLDVFSPREHQAPELEYGSVEWRQVTFDNDIDHIDWADFLFAIYDEEDAGTMMEIGYAYATGKPVLVYHEGHDIVNLMITDSLTAYFKDWATVSAYDYSRMKHLPYTGSVI
ncbi:nucleoside 2-deoxyribosyltransferase [Alkalicoccobacillus gibsonii]|uniref:nucleoside 2-deoxyribosyltransferase n=1 Tax=Alkalicoccobacillus gibsonii TaxID=79881 RepID=UPI003516DEA4